MTRGEDSDGLQSATIVRDRQGAAPFWLFWGATTASGMGTAVSALALQLTALTVLDVNAFHMGLLGAASFAGWLLIGLPAGPIASALPLKETQIGLDLVRAGAILSIPIVWVWGALSFGHLLLAALVVSFADVVFEVANGSFLPRVVPSAELLRRNSLMSGTIAVTNVGGPSIGGVLVQVVGAVPTLLVDAFSYVVSAIFLSRIPKPEAANAVPRRQDNANSRPSIKEGWALIRSDAVISSSMWYSTVTNFVAGGHLAVFVIHLTRTLDSPPALVGALLAVDGVAALLGAVLSSTAALRITPRAVVVTGATLSSVGALVIPAAGGASGIATFVIGVSLFSLGVVVVTTTTRTYRQIATPEALLPNVTAALRFISWGVVPVGSLVGGAAASLIGTRLTLAGFALIAIASIYFVLRMPSRDLLRVRGA